jgi:hypothetical protein
MKNFSQSEICEFAGIEPYILKNWIARGDVPFSVPPVESGKSARKYESTEAFLLALFCSLASEIGPKAGRRLFEQWMGEEQASFRIGRMSVQIDIRPLLAHFGIPQHSLRILAVLFKPTRASRDAAYMRVFPAEERA